MPTTAPPSPAARRAARASRARLAATTTGSRTAGTCALVGVTRADVRTRGGRRPLAHRGLHTVVIGTAAMFRRGATLAAVWESGPGAILDGVSALQAAGLRGFIPDAIDVSVPRRNRRRQVDGVSGRGAVGSSGPRIEAGVPRARPELAALRAAEWAATDRTAVLILCLVVQQRLVPPARLLSAWRSVRREPATRPARRAAIGDICDGAHSLGELDFGGTVPTGPGCRRRADRCVRTGPDGGCTSTWPGRTWARSSRSMEVTTPWRSTRWTTRCARTRSPWGTRWCCASRSWGSRLQPDRFMDQVVRAHRMLSGAAAQRCCGGAIGRAPASPGFVGVAGAAGRAGSYVAPQPAPIVPLRDGTESARIVVGVAGFEPAAFRSQSGRATKLRHTPRPRGTDIRHRRGREKDFGSRERGH